jgi:hypothetical protein
MKARLAGTLVRMSIELLEDSPIAEQLVETVLLRAAAVEIDRVMLAAAGNQVAPSDEPKGLIHWPIGNVPAVVPPVGFVPELAAMGQVLAAKARLDGYNAMLATLKQGKAFANPDSTRWALEPADDIPVGSALDKMAKNSRIYLRRVVEEHKGTPWAAIAERELRVPAGWKFVEK